jgi:hypothetical protein
MKLAWVLLHGVWEDEPVVTPVMNLQDEPVM